jgi:hypothetical protein
LVHKNGLVKSGIISTVRGQANLMKIIEDFQTRKLQIDLLKIELVQNRNDGNAIVYTGKGYIRQTDDDILTFRLYADEAKNTDMFTSLKSLSDPLPGTLYGESAYYTLRAIGSDGQSWRAEQILPQCDWVSGIDKPVVYGRLNSCVRGNSPTVSRSISLHYFEKVDVPCIINEISFSAQGFAFEVKKDDEGFVIGAHSDQELPPHFGTRIEEALRFLLAASVATRVRIQGSQLELNSATPRSRQPRLGPPISRGSIAFLEDSWRLFDHYLGFILREAESPYWHQCSNHLHNALEASANSMDAWAIGLGVAVEGVANLLPYSLPDEQKSQLMALQAFITKQVNESEKHKSFGNRVQGLAGQLVSVRAVDKMQWLAEQGGAIRDYVSAWRGLRNRGVHPTTGKADIASLDYQRYIDDLNKVGVLLYHITFHLIGYQGRYTDYGERGYPAKIYPPTSEANEGDHQTVERKVSTDPETSARSIFAAVLACLAKLWSKSKQRLFSVKARIVAIG